MPNQVCPYNKNHSFAYLNPRSGARQVECPECNGALMYYCRTCGAVILPNKSVCENGAHATPMTAPPASVAAHCQCPGCGISLPDKQSSCWNCHIPFAWRCPLCGHAMQPTDTQDTGPGGCGATFSEICPQLM